MLPIRSIGILGVRPQLNWQNITKPEDVNNDGKVFPIDALLVINELNFRIYQDPITKRFLSRSDPNLPFLDVNGDGFCYPIDALLVINELNRRPGGGEGEGEARFARTESNADDHANALADSFWLDDLFNNGTFQSRFWRRDKNRN